jgi:hypothetical protein
MSQLTIMLVMLAGLITMLDWRKGLTMCVLVGIAQDPLRKLAPGQPLYFVLLVGLIFAIAWLRATLVRVRLSPSVIYGWRENLKVPFSLFIALVLIQAMHSFVRYGSALMAGIGILVWLAPIPAVVLAYQYAARRGLLGVRAWMLLYVAVAGVALSGVYFEYAGFGWRALGEIGEGQIIYDMGTALKAYSGFFRASETAAWHAATIGCFIFILSIGKRATVLRIVLALLLIAGLVSLGLLTGRRKMLVEISIFMATYVFLIAVLQKGMARLAVIVAMMAAVGYIGIVGFVAPDPVRRTETPPLENAQRMEGYAARGRTVFADLPARVSALGARPVIWAVETYGWFGAGLGTGSQGANDIAAANGINRWGSEGGLGKIAMELGLPGLLMLAWLLKALAGHLRQQLIAMSKTSPQHARMAYGLIAFLVANAATFSVATQAYSDLFVLLILGWSLGFLLAMPILAATGDATRRRSARRFPSPLVTEPLGAGRRAGSLALRQKQR